MIGAVVQVASYGSTKTVMDISLPDLNFTMIKEIDRYLWFSFPLHCELYRNMRNLWLQWHKNIITAVFLVWMTTPHRSGYFVMWPHFCGVVIPTRNASFITSSSESWSSHWMTKTQKRRPCSLMHMGTGRRICKSLDRCCTGAWLLTGSRECWKPGRERMICVVITCQYMCANVYLRYCGPHKVLCANVHLRETGRN